MLSAHIDSHHKEQSVEEHCRQTAAYVSQEAVGLGLSYTMQLAGLLHDMGKNTQRFNTYIHDAHQGRSPAQKLNHSSAGAKFLLETTTPLDDNARLTQQLIAYAILSHHGLNDCLSYDGEDKFSARLSPDAEDYAEAVDNSRSFLDSDEVQKIFVQSCGEIDTLSKAINAVADRMKTAYPIQEKCFLQGCLARLMLSMLMDADRRDTAEFMNGEREQRMDDDQRTAYFSECLDRLHGQLAVLANKPDRNRIDDLRQELSDQCLIFAEHHGSGIYRLPIPTGGGKTLSAMRFALRLAQREHKDRVLYAAPFLSILEQNAAVIKGVLGDSEHILEHHSNVTIDESLGDDALKTYELLADNWSSPLILTTMVRLLDVLFGKSTMDIRRMHQLKNAVIIIDEAQAIPVRYIHLFNTMMNFLAYVVGSTIVLCTATQPIFENTDRPLLYAPDDCIITDIDRYHYAFQRAEIITDYWQPVRSTEALADLVLRLTDHNALVILNTKSAVQKLYDYLKTVLPPQYRLVQLTTYLCPQHRLDMIQSIQTALADHQPLICISTQLIEAGVDISFQTVFRSLSGLDSIAQAAGRCNRHGIAQTLGKVYIVQYEEEHLASLEDIRAGQEAMRIRMAEYHGETLLMPAAITAYYEQYFYQRKNIMDAPAQHYSSDYSSKQSLYSFLGSNFAAKKEYRNYQGALYPFPLAQSFKTAAALFSPIEKTNAVSVIVYYKEAKELIERLYAVSDLGEQRKLLRKLQRYSVTMMTFSSQFRALKEQSCFEETFYEGKILLLTESYYSMETGVDTRFHSLIL